MLNDPVMVRHLVESAVALTLCGIIVACSLLVTSGGRKVLRGVARLICKDPLKSMVVAVGIWVATAYGGSKPTPPPIITDEGIRLLRVVQTPREIGFLWSTSDENIVLGVDEFMIQEEFPGGWVTIGRTTGTNYVHSGFTINKRHRYRIAVDVTPLLDRGDSE